MFGLKSLTHLVRTVAIAAAGVLAIGLVSSTCQAQTKVACIGDSITAGYGLSNPGADSYPAQLQSLLGSGYKVNNYGWSGTTVQKTGDSPYWNVSYYNDSRNWAPNIVVIMLGTNDSKSWNWNAMNFNADFLLTYLVHPGTAIYVGYNSNLQNLDRRLLPTPSGLLTTRDDFINDGRQFFVKVSYLFRL